MPSKHVLLLVAFIGAVTGLFLSSGIRRGLAQFNRAAANLIDPLPPPSLVPVKCPEITECLEVVDTGRRDRKTPDFIKDWQVKGWSKVDEAWARQQDDKTWRAHLTYYNTDMFISGTADYCQCSVEPHEGK